MFNQFSANYPDLVVPSDIALPIRSPRTHPLRIMDTCTYYEHRLLQKVASHTL